ncbi:MAG: TonB-dependent receptor [Caulobacteraceae bacterium]
MAKREKQEKAGRSVWHAVLFATTALGGNATSQALAQDREQSAVGEIVVTATKREENLQDVPMSVQALGEERLEELGITDFADYAQHLPTLSYSPSYGPGYNRPFMRGVASGENGNHSGSMPSVGTYLDEQPITTIVGNLDMHIYDVARVEVLAGPQGTLYGASSQAGTVRIITNRPDPSDFSAAFDLEANAVRHGDWGQVGEGYVNIPINNSTAVRIVGWAEHAAGYIDNRQGTRLYPTSGVLDENSDVAEKDYNDVDTYGGRIALGIDLNESWTVTPQVMGQHQESNGIFAEQSDIGDLAVMHWFPEWNEDNWVQGALTIEGQVSNFDVVFAASLLSRDVDSNQDYADYGFFYDTVAGYGCYYTDNTTPGACFAAVGFPGDPINPAQQVEGRDHYNRDTYELRVSSPSENRLRGIVGLFYQNSEHEIHQRYVLNNFRDEMEVAGWPDTIWLTQQIRTDQESAAFGELSFDFTDRLTGTVGIRAFETQNSLVGFFGFGVNYSGSTGESQCFGPPIVGGSPCTNLDASTEETGQLYRANLEWNIDDDRMVYATYSEGFRPGGINRRGSFGPYDADFLDNFEIGWKSDWANGRLRWNGAVFHQEWKDFQYAFIDVGSAGLTQIQNAGDAEIDGLETDIIWVPFDGLTLTGGAAWLSTELTNADIVGTVAGTELPVSPDLKLDVTARYEFMLGNWEAFVQGGATYIGERGTSLIVGDAELLGTLPDYWTADISAGIEQNGLRISLFIDNLFDERAITGRYTECAVGTCMAPPLGDALEGVYYDVVVRPMTAGVRVGRRF